MGRCFLSVLLLTSNRLRPAWPEEIYTRRALQMTTNFYYQFVAKQLTYKLRSAH